MAAPVIDEESEYVEETGAFGDTDGSRANITDLLRGFVGFEGHAAYGGLREGIHELRGRVIVGGKGAGKSVYLRRLQALAAKQDGVYSAHERFYTDVIQHDVPTTESVVKVSHWYAEDYLTEKWKWIWRRGIMRSLVSHLLCAKDLKPQVPDELRDELATQYAHLYRAFRKPVSIYSQVREVINGARSATALNAYLEAPAWDDLEVTLREVLRGCSPVCFYVDAVDDEFAHAPSYWLVCQKGLFYEVMRLLREQQFGGRLHVMICVRDVVFSSVLRGEHASRYRESPHIRMLDWDESSLKFFMNAKLRSLPKRYFPGISDDERTVSNWLGVNAIKNGRQGQSEEEEIVSYLLRHIRPLPRDIVTLGNKLCRALDGRRTNGNGLPEEWIRDVVAEAAKQFGDEQLTICANQMSADMMPAHAEQHRYSNVYTGASAYAPVVSVHLKRFLHDHVGRDRFDNAFCRRLATIAGREFSSKTNVLSVMWQHGLVGYGQGDMYGDDVMFYRLNDRSDEHVLPLDRDFYVLHSCLIDSAGVVPIGPPVTPYRQRPQ